MLETYSGQNHFALQRALRARIAEFVQEHGELAYEQLEGDEATFERIQEAITSLPFLAAQKLVVLQNPGANKQFQEHVLEQGLDTPDVTTVLFVEPQVDKRGKYYKWLKANTTFTDHAQLDERSLATWAVSFAKEQGTALSLPDAQYLIQRVGTDQSRLASELEKLALAGGQISRSSIDILTEPTPQSKIFDLLEAAFGRNPRRAIDLYNDQRAQKVEPQEIIAMLGWQLRQIALAKAAGTKHDLVRDAKISPYGATKARRIADSLTIAQLRQYVADLTELDVKSKRQTINLDQALRTYVLQLAEA